MLKLIPVLAIVLFASCRLQRPLYSKPSQNNDTYRVQYLFEHDGCKVYRFFDMGNYVYFTNCAGEAVAQHDSSAVTNRTRLASKHLHPGVHQQ